MKRGFILPLVLLILALMSGIAVVLGRLSSEKTLSLKNQEGSYYSKEITVTLVDEEETDDSDSGDSGEGTETLIGSTDYNLTLKKKKDGITTVNIKNVFDGVDFENGNYNVKIVSNSNQLSAVMLDTTSIESFGNMAFEGAAYIIRETSKLYLTNKSNANKQITITVTLTPN